MHRSHFNGRPVVFTRGTVILVLFLVVGILLSCSVLTPTQTTSPQDGGTTGSTQGDDIKNPPSSDFSRVRLTKLDVAGSSSGSLSSDSSLGKPPVLILLMDYSGSMVECGKQRPQLNSINASVVFFLSALFKDKAEVYIAELPSSGESTNIRSYSDFGATSSQKELEEKIQPRKGHLKNHFQKALQDIHDRFASEQRKYIVLLISDGAFSDIPHTGKRDGVDNWLKENEHFTSNLYMLLWDCRPESYNESEYLNDKNLWEARLGPDRLQVVGTDTTNDTRGVGELIMRMAENTALRGALPISNTLLNNGDRVQSGWIWLDRGLDRKLTDIPGYTRLVTVGLFVLSPSIEQTELYLKIGDEQKKISAEKLSGDPQSIEVPSPESGGNCVDRSLNLSFNLGDIDGLLVYYTWSPEFVHDRLELKEELLFNTGDSFVFDNVVAPSSDNTVFWNKPWNNDGFVMKIHGFYDVSGGRSAILDYHECYKMQLTVLSDTGDKPVSVSFEGRGDEDEFSSFWDDQLMEIPKDKVKELFSRLSIDRPAKVTFMFELFTYDNEKVVSKWQSDDIKVRFYPVIKPQDSNSKEGEAEGIKIFEYGIYEFADCTYYGNCDSGGNKLEAYIYIPENTNMQDIRECTGDKPTKTTIFNYHDIDVVVVKDAPPKRKILISLDATKIRLTVQDYQSFLDKCHYQYLVLKWDQLMPSYICDLVANKCGRADEVLRNLTQK